MASPDSMPIQRPPARRRRWRQFSLRTLLIVITVVSVWLGIKVDQARRQKRAVDALRALGAEVAYEHQRTPTGDWFDRRIKLDVPTWAKELCGEDFFQAVTGVYFAGRLNEERTGTVPYNLTDEDLRCLADLPHIEQILIDNAPVTDAGLAHLRYPERLTCVELLNTRAGDGFVRRLKGAGLKVLNLANSRVTDDGLSELGGITSLVKLWLDETETGDRGLSAFAKCKGLEVLSVGSRTTDEGLRQLEALESLNDLRAVSCDVTGSAFRGRRMGRADQVTLRKCPIGDAELTVLVAALKDVRVVNLAGCPITDDGLQHLAELGKTEILVLANTNVRGRELRRLASLSGIAWLALNGCPLDEPDLKALEPLYTGTAAGMYLSLDKTPIDDDDLEKISGFTNLTHLSLSHTNVTDAGLLHLHTLTKLAVLDLRVTRVTADGIKRLKQAIPGLNVAWDDDPRPPGWPW